jgi:hypothetical protein
MKSVPPRGSGRFRSHSLSRCQISPGNELPIYYPPATEAVKKRYHRLQPRGIQVRPKNSTAEPEETPPTSVAWSFSLDPLRYVKRQKLKHHATEVGGVSDVMRAAGARQKLKDHAAEAGGLFFSQLLPRRGTDFMPLRTVVG